jgi:hypothetical protein
MSDGELKLQQSSIPADKVPDRIHMLVEKWKKQTYDVKQKNKIVSELRKWGFLPKKKPMTPQERKDKNRIASRQYMEKRRKREKEIVAMYANSE